MARQPKDPNRLRFKDYLGTTLMGATDGVAAGVMTSMFMLYLTDYAGIGNCILGYRDGEYPKAPARRGEYAVYVK